MLRKEVLDLSGKLANDVAIDAAAPLGEVAAKLLVVEHQVQLLLLSQGGVVNRLLEIPDVDEASKWRESAYLRRRS